MERRTFIGAIAGGLLAAPLVAVAQHPAKLPRIGITTAEPAHGPYTEALTRGLSDLGWVEGQNILVDYRSAEGRPERFPALIAELIRLKVDIIVAGGGTVGARAAKRATSTIPIVMPVVTDPVGAGLAFFIWLPLLLLPARLRAGVAGLVLCAYVVALRLEPFTFQAVAHEFGWIPFLSLMQGSLTVDTLAFLEKIFLYGSMIYLLGNALGHRLPAALLTAALLFATSWAETRLSGRSAEITDALMALIVTGIFVLLGPERADDRLHDPGSLSAMMAEQAQPCAGFAARAGAGACRR